MSSFNNKLKKVVTFEEDITIRYYEYDKVEEYEEKKGRNWQETTNLICREFKVPLENGGCGGDWNVLQTKLDKLEEPYWYLIGQLWQRLFPCIKRIEEWSSDEDEYEDQLADQDKDQEEEPSADKDNTKPSADKDQDK